MAERKPYLKLNPNIPVLAIMDSDGCVGEFPNTKFPNKDGSIPNQYLYFLTVNGVIHAFYASEFQHNQLKVFKKGDPIKLLKAVEGTQTRTLIGAPGDISFENRNLPQSAEMSHKEEIQVEKMKAQQKDANEERQLKLSRGAAWNCAWQYVLLKASGEFYTNSSLEDFCKEVQRTAEKIVSYQQEFVSGYMPTKEYSVSDEVPPVTPKDSPKSSPDIDLPF